jgi:hypothetical protein
MAWDFRLGNVQPLSKLYYLPTEKSKAVKVAYGFRWKREFFGFIKE